MHCWIADRNSTKQVGKRDNRWGDHSSMIMKHNPSDGTSSKPRIAVIEHNYFPCESREYINAYEYNDSSDLFARPTMTYIARYSVLCLASARLSRSISQSSHGK